MVKRIGMFQKFVKTKKNEVKLFKILQDRSKTNVFFSNCVEEKKENMKLRFLGGKKRRKTNIIVPQLSKICHCYCRVTSSRGRNENWNMMICSMPAGQQASMLANISEGFRKPKGTDL
jgi:hypothetical protein